MYFLLLRPLQNLPLETPLDSQKATEENKAGCFQQNKTQKKRQQVHTPPFAGMKKSAGFGGRNRLSEGDNSIRLADANSECPGDFQNLKVNVVALPPRIIHLRSRTEVGLIHHSYSTNLYFFGTSGRDISLVRLWRRRSGRNAPKPILI